MFSASGGRIMTKPTALLVIDVQESFRHRPYFRPDELPSFFDHSQRLCDAAKSRGWPIVRVLHVEDEGAFSLASGWVAPMPELVYTPDLIVHKQRHSALVKSALPAWLTEHGISRLIVSGLRTEQCCETTTRHASDSGYAVDFVTEATLTFPMQHPNGRKYTTQEIRERTELVLHDRFARIATVQDILCE
jgi:nicotinamidase-related amidase